MAVYYTFDGTAMLGSIVIDVDANLVKLFNASAPIDGNLVKLISGNVLPVDANLVKAFAASLPVDANLVKLITATAPIDANLVKLLSGFTAPIDANLVKFFTGLTIPIDAYVEASTVTNQRYYTNTIKKIWQNVQSDILADYRDTAQIYFNPVETGVTSSGYDSFFGEGTNPVDPNTYDNDTVETTAGDLTVRGKFRNDLYGSSISPTEGMQQVGIGDFQPGDALFTCLYVASLEDSTDSSKGTIFDTCKKVVITGEAYNYVVKAVTFRGLGETFITDVWLEKSNIV